MVNHLNILISHAYDERGLAEAWKKLIEAVSIGIINVWFSSDTSATGGVEMGKPWVDDLYQRIVESDFILAIQTPASAGRPWIMWECGAGSGASRERGIIPIVYSIGRGELANPLTIYQVYQGDNAAQVREVCQRLTQKAQLAPQDYIYEESIKTYLTSVNLYRPRKVLRADDIALWRNRIESLVQSGRASELTTVRQMMYASLGKPIDATIHDTLSQYLLQQRNYEAAIEETDHALALSPDDVQFLHRKALALVELHNLNEGRKLLERIIKLDRNLEVNSEIGSLLGRIHREQWTLTQDPVELDAAIEAYYRPYQADKTQYYPGMNAAELAFAKGDLALGTEIMHEVLDTCQRLQKRESVVSYWIDFTSGAAYLGLGDIENAMNEYTKGLNRIPAPAPRDRESARKGVIRMANVKKLPKDEVDRIEALLK